MALSPADIVSGPANRVAAIHLQPNTDGSHTRHIAAIKWCHDSTPSNLVPSDIGDVILRIGVLKQVFYTLGDDGIRARVDVVAGSNGSSPYIRTAPDGSKPDNLLSLPRY